MNKNIILTKESGLSLKAKGLYYLIQSFASTPIFELNKEELMEECIEGSTAFDSAWKELKDKGYLIQHRLKSENRGFYYRYELLDKPKK